MDIDYSKAFSLPLNSLAYGLGKKGLVPEFKCWRVFFWDVRNFPTKCNRKCKRGDSDMEVNHMGCCCCALKGIGFLCKHGGSLNVCSMVKI